MEVEEIPPQPPTPELEDHRGRWLSFWECQKLRKHRFRRRPQLRLPSGKINLHFGVRRRHLTRRECKPSECPVAASAHPARFTQTTIVYASVTYP